MCSDVINTHPSVVHTAEVRIVTGLVGHPFRTLELCWVNDFDLPDYGSGIECYEKIGHGGLFISIALEKRWCEKVEEGLGERIRESVDAVEDTLKVVINRWVRISGYTASIFLPS